MSKPVVYFDIGCRDHGATVAFYTELFGWETEPREGLSTRVISGEGGIDGGITALGHEPHNYVMIYAEVDDLEAAIERAVELGGEHVLGPLPTQDGRRFAWLKDVEGSLFGVLGPAA